MIDAGLPASRQDWPTASLLLSDWEQGDVLERPPFFYFADPSAAIWELTRVCSGQPEGVLELYEDERPRFGMITTQTCDICEEDSDPPKRPWVSVAPVFEVTESGYKKLVTKCTGPRYWFWIPGIEEAGVWAADLRVEVPVEKGWLASQTRIVGFPDQESRQKLRERLAWIKGRPAFSSGFNSAVAIPLHVALRELIRSEGGPRGTGSRPAGRDCRFY